MHVLVVLDGARGLAEGRHPLFELGLQLGLPCLLELLELRLDVFVGLLLVDLEHLLLHLLHLDFLLRDTSCF